MEKFGRGSSDEALHLRVFDPDLVESVSEPIRQA